MQVVNPQIVSGKKVLLRYDIDVALNPLEDFKLKAGLATLRLCLENAEQVILMGHVGRPDGKVVPELSVEPIRQWFSDQGFNLNILENLRFDPREEACDPEYAKELAQMGDFYVNEAFSAYHRAVSTTILPTLLPHAAGLHFAKEVQKLIEVRNPPAGGPKKPFIAIMGGAKVLDKLPVIKVLAKKADAVLVGGKLIHEIREQNIQLPANVLVGKLSEDGFDIAPETTEAWKRLIRQSRMIVWNGPVGKFEDSKNEQTKNLARAILDCGAEIIIGGGDSVAALSQYGLFEEAEQKAFISVGGGAMLNLLADGTLPTIEALK
ncbi:MAG: Phosphoglycerate kinase [Microgenomates group bacterium Gr01-1014_7]|nr:MAG: Phosphoglycerate kinase [Microgenomates group bacterium Gr01-1014_7]